MSCIRTVYFQIPCQKLTSKFLNQFFLKICLRRIWSLIFWVTIPYILQILRSPRWVFGFSSGGYQERGGRGCGRILTSLAGIIALKLSFLWIICMKNSKIGVYSSNDPVLTCKRYAWSTPFFTSLYCASLKT